MDFFYKKDPTNCRTSIWLCIHTELYYCLHDSSYTSRYLYISVSDPSTQYKPTRRIRFVCMFLCRYFKSFTPFLYARVRFTQIFSRLIKNYTLLYIHFFLLFIAVSPQWCDFLCISMHTLPLWMVIRLTILWNFWFLVSILLIPAKFAIATAVIHYRCGVV